MYVSAVFEPKGRLEGLPALALLGHPNISQFGAIIEAHLLDEPRFRVAQLGPGVCVCNPWNHRDPFGLFGFWFCFHFYRRGVRSHWDHAEVAADHLGPLPTKTPI